MLEKDVVCLLGQILDELKKLNCRIDTASKQTTDQRDTVKKAKDMMQSVVSMLPVEQQAMMKGVIDGL